MSGPERHSGDLAARRVTATHIEEHFAEIIVSTYERSIANLEDVLDPNTPGAFLEIKAGEAGFGDYFADGTPSSDSIRRYELFSGSPVTSVRPYEQRS